MISILLLDSAFTEVKRDARFYNRCVNRVQFVNTEKVYEKGTFSIKNGI